MCLDESTIDALVSHTPLMRIVYLSFEVIFEDELKFLGDHIEDTTIKLIDDSEFFRSKRRKKNMRKVRNVRNNMVRMKAKLTKRLSSIKSPLKRTHWENGKRLRGRN